MSINKSILKFAAASVIACGTIASSYATEPPANPADGTASSSYVSDAAITAKVKAALISSKLMGISVTTELGVVALIGSVPNEAVRETASRIVASVDGVRGVDYSGLSVKANS